MELLYTYALVSIIAGVTFNLVAWSMFSDDDLPRVFLRLIALIFVMSLVWPCLAWYESFNDDMHFFEWE